MTPIAQLIAELRELAERRAGAVGGLKGSATAIGSVLSIQAEHEAALLTRAAEALARQEELLAEAGRPWRPICEYEPSMGEVETLGCLHDPRSAFGERAKVQLSRLTEHGFVSDEWGGHEPVFFRAAARLSDKLKGE